ncbi:hypothetical protein IBX65_02585 [Candidatus Aerophobetes bacterium]|nr:hypothetical protein [Candidatus Aerophobetes bacterium]
MSLDLGTTVCKAALFNIEGKLIDIATEEYPVISSHPGWAEQDTEIVWEKVVEVIGRIARKTHADEVIQSICISAQGEAVVFLDKKGNPLRHCILGMDMRSTEQTKRLKEEFSKEKLYHISGVIPHPITTLAKILWVKDNQPDIFKNVAQFLCYEDFIFSRLGGIAAIDYSLASRTMMFDIDEKKWCSWILDYTEIKEEQLARVYPSGKVVGKVSPGIAKKLGLSKEVKLVTGGHDVTCAALGTGAIKEGIGANILGTAEIFGLTLEDRQEAQKLKTFNFACYPHVLPEKYFLMSLNQTGGLLLKWFRDNFAEKEIEIAKKEARDAFELLVAKAKNKPADSMVLPHLVGSGTPWVNPLSKAAVIGLTLHTGKSDILKAVLESVCFEQKINIEILEKYGFATDEIRAVGGQAKSDKWLKIRADILGKTIKTLKVSDASCLGGAILSSYALGYYPSIDEAAQVMVKVKSEIEPDKSFHKRYLEKYQIFKKVYPALKEINYELSGILKNKGNETFSYNLYRKG